MREHTEILMKPASGDCNLKCRYCFYEDVKDNRAVASFGYMSLDTLEAIVKKTLANTKQSVSFSFQGGEPTLVGLDFYRSLLNLEKKYNTNNIPICHTVQTNGILIDDEWAEFFAENRFLIGLSMDGDKALHDIYRVDFRGKGTHQRIMKTVETLKRHGVEFNILTVVTEEIAGSAKKIYDFYKSNNLLYQQYMPCILPFEGQLSSETSISSLTAKSYGKFLKDLFDCWYSDIKSGQFIYNRYFEGLVGIIKGYPPENCGMYGHCLAHYVVEADGSVYPCDFYMLDELKLGNLAEDSFEAIDRKRAELKFIEISAAVSVDCGSCKWAGLCRGGCRRDRDVKNHKDIGHNRYCEGFKDFFDYAYERLCSF